MVCIQSQRPIDVIFICLTGQSMGRLPSSRTGQKHRPVRRLDKRGGRWPVCRQGKKVVQSLSWAKSPTTECNDVFADFWKFLSKFGNSWFFPVIFTSFRSCLDICACSLLSTTSQDNSILLSLGMFWWRYKCVYSRLISAVLVEFRLLFR